MRQAFREADRQVKAAAAVAPARISSAAAIVADTVSALVAALEVVDYDINKVPRSTLDSISAPRFKDAETSIQNYARDVCGIG